MTRYLVLLLFWVVPCAAGGNHTDEPNPEMVARTECVVFDIDGTLTPKVSAIRTARDGAATAVQAFADAGYLVIYLSARVRLLQRGIPDWLEQNGFPHGRLHLTESREERKDHAAFKAGVLQDYRAAGWRCIAAYGDSSSDFEAYVSAGINPQRIFALKRADADSCQPGEWAACYETWEEQIDIILDMVKARD